MSLTGPDSDAVRAVIREVLAEFLPATGSSGPTQPAASQPAPAQPVPAPQPVPRAAPAQPGLAYPVSEDAQSVETVSLRTDARVGGSFSFVVRRNGQQLDHVGEYLELDRPRRLVFTWGVQQDGGATSKVVVEIAAVEGGCELTLTHEMEPRWASFTASAEASWTKMLNAIEAALA